MNKFYLITLLFTIFSSFGSAQINSVSLISSSKYIKISKKPINLPILEIKDLKFIDTDKNQKIDVEEVTFLNFILSNTGKGVGRNITVELNEINKVPGLFYDPITQLSDLEPGKISTINIPLKGDFNLINGTSNFILKINEANGFGTDITPVEIQTQAFKEPELKVVDYLVKSQNASNVSKKEPFDVQAMVQNLGKGIASNVTVTLNLPSNTICLSENIVTTLGDLLPGDKRSITYNLIANNNYSSDNLPIEFQLEEKYKKYSTPFAINIQMNQRVSNEKLTIQGLDDRKVKIEMASLNSDVDKNIPIIDKIYPNKIALIFGNEDYSESINAQVNVTYATRDAQVFKEYANKILGVDESNLFVFYNATAGVMKREIDRVSKLAQKMGDATELYFYYAGHGLPDEKTKVPYLVPIDINVANLSDAISLKDLYSTFGSTGISKITLFLDACFSGGGRSEPILSARGVRIVPEKQQILGNMVVFAASQGDQVALPYHDQKHGLFTYFLLKKLKESSNGKLNYKTLDEYLKKMVGIESIRIAKEQDPIVHFSPKISNEWEKWTF